ncbi:lysophospholipid acyltransferase family protein [Roseivirga sp.]|uniref:lysophospholipid acyltransferase family protein n=1 Tax=Roseivirga sp. TaxID=1964215 RepID=UPI002B26CDEE|nr:lysophospholipid acyltransferase family protein [Roseivirga sp.]
MAPVFYYLIIKPLSLLPLWALYTLSDFLYMVAYKIGRYRVRVVSTNLKNSFPNHSEKELIKIRQQFYRHFSDLLVESLKIFSISEEEAKARFVVTNPEVLQPFIDTNRSILIVGGHYNNWEMLAVGIDAYIEHQSVAIYHALKNKFLNEKILASRSKFGLKMISRPDVKAFFANTTTLTATIFGADQSPSIAKKVYWTHFLNQETAVMFGVEKFAKEKNSPVVFGGIKKIKRGYYEFTFKVLFTEPTRCIHGEITESHVRRLEKQILEAPQYWLWTHKRWKRKKTKEERLEEQALTAKA